MTRFALLACALGLVLLQEDKPAPAPAPVVGEPAPALRLNDHTGHARRIGGESDGWTVLAFFPKAATPG